MRKDVLEFVGLCRGITDKLLKSDFKQVIMYENRINVLPDSSGFGLGIDFEFKISGIWFFY